jgi:hypothetical protein
MREDWKRWLLKGAGFGVGFALTLALIVGLWLWHSSRPRAPKRWDTTKISASFLGLQGWHTADQFVFRVTYTLHNPTETDYALPSPPQGVLMKRLSSNNSLERITDASWESNTTIPARHDVTVAFIVPITLSFYNTTGNKLNDDKEEIHFMSLRMKEMDGFSFLDYDNRYQIELPNGWKGEKHSSDSR